MIKDIIQEAYAGFEELALVSAAGIGAIIWTGSAFIWKHKLTIAIIAAMIFSNGV
jgi:hypothetical protein